MKNRLFLQLIMYSRYTCYAFLLQIFTMSILLASDGNAQNVSSVKEVKINIQFADENVIQAFRKIEALTNFNFSYNKSDLQGLNRISGDYEGQSLYDILMDISRQAGIGFKQVNNLIGVTKIDGKKENKTTEVEIILEVSVSGTVTDGETGEGLPGVNVVVKGTTIGTVTDLNGSYNIEVPSTESVLVFSSISFLTEEITVGNQAVIDVALSPDVQALEEIVVIGYGSREKKDVTTSISTISSETLTKSTVSMAPEMAMQGRMTGVLVSGNTGNPMDRPTVRIRGVNTWGSAEPLYVVDGIPITELGSGIDGQEDARIADVRGPINIMTMIDPNDIESISVLKDASAAAIYGVRAANGVVLITTKKGKTEKPTVNFSARYGVQNIPKTWDVLNTQQFVDFYDKAYAANPNQVLDPEFDPSSPRYLGDTQETYNWQTPLINQNAATQDYSVRVSGLTDKTDYYMSANYAKTEGVLINQSLERYSANFKINTKINNWLKTGINYRLAYVNGMDKNDSDITDRAQTPPWQPIYDPNGPDYLKGYAPVIVGYDENGNWSTAKLYGEGTRNNLLGRMALNTTNYNSLRNLGNAYVELTPLENLSIKGSIGVDVYDNERIQFRDWNADYFAYSNSTDPNSWAGGQSVGKYGERTTTNLNIVKEITINYRKSFGDHNLDFLFSGMDQQYSAKYKGESTEFMTTLNPDLWALSGDNEYTQIESDIFRHALQGLLGRVSYNYNYKYYLDITVRRDGSNRFAPENRWGTFPSASAAWRISAEPFMQSLNWITDLKLRAGWGQLGNQEVRDFAYLSPVSKNPTYAFGSNPGGNGLGNYGVGAAMFSFPNPAISWETTTTTNIGFDAFLFDKLSASVEYYSKLTDGILQETSIPPSVGSKESPIANLAKVKNEGIEFSLSYDNTIGKLNYNVGANFSTVKNEVLATYNDIPFGNESNRIEVGYPMNYIYGYQEGGIFQSDAEITTWEQSNEDQSISQEYQPGDRYFVDVNGAPNPEEGYRFYTPGPDGQIDQYDRTYLGKTLPGFFYGFNVGLNMMGFDFSAYFQGIGDVQKYNYARATMEYLSSRGANMSTAVLNAWSDENKSTTMSRPVVGDPNNSLRFSSQYVENAAYLRLGNAQLGYTLPESALNATGDIFQSLRMYVSVSNAFVITQWKGLDPENDLNPMPRVFSVGLNASF